MTEKFLNELISLARHQPWDERGEDFCAIDFSGTHVDDAYWGGVVAGESKLARRVLDELGVRYD